MEWFIAAASLAAVLTAAGIFLVKFIDWRIDLKLSDVNAKIHEILGWLRGKA